MKLYTLDNKFIKETDDRSPSFTGIIENSGGTREWYFKGFFHRLDGAAIEYTDGSKSWWIDNKRHRVDGPAIERKSGTKEWWVYDKQVTEEQCKLLHSIMKLKGLLIT